VLVLAHFTMRRWLWPSLLVALGILFLMTQAIPRMRDGAYDLRQVHHAMNDESLILERVWEMVDKGDLHHRVGAYPGLYPYAAAVVRWASLDSPPKVVIIATRWMSLYAMIAALVLTFIMFGRLAENPWVGSLLAFAMSLHPEIVLWSCRVHPDAFALLFTHASLAFLGLAVDRERPRDLILASVFAALSAGTKLHGVFIMPVISAVIVWQHHRDRRRVLIELARHALIFGAIFILCNPNLLKFPRGIINGFLSIQTDNVASGGSPFDWFPAFLGPRGLGWSGTIASLFGLLLVAARRRIDGVAMVAAFAVLYLVVLISTVRMIEVRYAFPATWPLLFVGLAAIVPRTRRDVLKIAATAVLIASFLWFDRPHQQRVLAEMPTMFERSLTPALLDLGQQLRLKQKTNPGRVVSSPYVWVPSGIKWTYVWSFEDLPALPDTTMVLVDHHLRLSQPGKKLAALLSGETGFVATATVGDVVIYERGSAR
jgi:hypothetical protein